MIVMKRCLKCGALYYKSYHKCPKCGSDYWDLESIHEGKIWP
jgi:uncharacterized OB-fold protein